MKRIISIIFVLFLVSSVSAAMILMHPPNLEFSGKINERLCNKVLIYSDYKGNLIGNIKWTNLRYKINDIKQYIKNSSELDIKPEFPEVFASTNKEKEIEVCLTFQDSGTYYGALLYSTEGSPAGVGIWINANIKGEGFAGITKFTGNIIRVSSETLTNSKNLKFLFLFSPTIFLVILLLLLLFYKKRMNYEESEGSKEDKNTQKDIKEQISKPLKKSSK